jgi:predicted PhzF superfamily epimerase YddE/YHI9
VIITARSDQPEFDFISRFFAPQLGIDEDPVTGSAHCLLTPYWAEKLGMTQMAAYQASERGGRLDVRLAGERVHLSGEARIIFRAELLV